MTFFDTYEYSKYSSMLVNSFEDVINEKIQIATITKNAIHPQRELITKRIDEHLDKILTKLVQMAKTHQYIMGYRYYWISKKTFNLRANQRISIKSSEHRNRVKHLQAHCFSQNELTIRFMLKKYDYCEIIKPKTIKINNADCIDILHNQLNAMTKFKNINQVLESTKYNRLLNLEPVNSGSSLDLKQKLYICHVKPNIIIKRKVGRPRKIVKHSSPQQLDMCRQDTAAIATPIVSPKVAVTPIIVVDIDTSNYIELLHLNLSCFNSFNVLDDIDNSVL